jgi:cyanophycinase
VSRGWIIPIGGRIESASLLARFVELAGSRRAPICVIATASSEADTGPLYESRLRDAGAREVKVLPLSRRGDCDDGDWLALLARAGGVFFTGGNQGRLATVLGGTPVAELIRRRNATEGLVVGGSSAGAAFLPVHMIAGGTEGPTPHSKMVTLAPGLGLIDRAIVDQHFTQRNRLGRLLSAMAYNPSLVGLGVDEDTGAFIGPDDVLEVEGSGGVTVVDPSRVEFSSIDSAQPHEAVALLGLTLHCLVAGTTFDLVRREAHVGDALLARHA